MNQDCPRHTRLNSHPGILRMGLQFLFDLQEDRIFQMFSLKIKVLFRTH